MPGDPGALALVVGASRAIWPRFLEGVREDAALAAEAHPLDRWVERTVSDAARGLPVRHLRFAHEPPYLPMQKIAALAGLAWLSPAYLSVHPLHGPWISLRALLVLDEPGPTGEPPGTPRPCHACPHACVPALERALAAGPASHAGVTAARDRWIAVRDACPVGRGSRYGEDQLRYHYAKVGA